MENQLRFIQEDFCAYLETMNYSTSTINHATKTVTEFMQWHTEQGVTDFKDYNSISIQRYFMAQTRRANKRQGGGLSAVYINKKLSDLKLLERYLLKRYHFELPIIFRRLTAAKNEVEILTQQEIKHLYNSIDTTSAIGLRDRAFLSIYYGVGLRRAEGTRLALEDVKLDSRIIHVKRSKNGRERFVPMALTVMQDLREYLTSANLKGRKPMCFC